MLNSLNSKSILMYNYFLDEVSATSQCDLSDRTRSRIWVTLRGYKASTTPGHTAADQACGKHSWRRQVQPVPAAVSSVYHECLSPISLNLRSRERPASPQVPPGLGHPLGHRSQLMPSTTGLLTMSADLRRGRGGCATPRPAHASSPSLFCSFN